MQITDLITTLPNLSDEQLMELLRERRHNRTTIRPAGKARAKRVERKGLQGRVSKVENLLAGLTADQKAQLLLELGEG